MDALADADWNSIGRAALASIPVAVTVLGFMRGPTAMRSRLKQDLELLSLFPADSRARGEFEDYLHGQVERFARREADGRRDIQGLVISGVLVVGFGALALYLFGIGQWWSWGLGVLISMLCFGGMASMFEDAQRVPRDPKGKPI